MERLPIALAIIILSATVCFAGGPNYGPNYTPQNSDKEFQNVYHDLQYPKISTGTAQNFYIANGSGTLFNVSSGTYTNLTAKNLTVSPGGTITGITGRILQQVSATCTTTKSTTLTTFQSTCLTASITPSSASSKVLVLVSGTSRTTCVSGDQNNNGYFTIDRGGTDLSGGAGLGYSACNNGTATTTLQVGGTVGLAYLDAPASTSSLAYTLQVRKGQGSQNIDWLDQNQKGSITLLEYL